MRKVAMSIVLGLAGCASVSNHTAVEDAVTVCRQEAQFAVPQNSGYTSETVDWLTTECLDSRLKTRAAPVS